MFHSISWLQFFFFLFLCFLAYYGYFGLVYYRAGLIRFVREKQVPAIPGMAEAAAMEKEKEKVGPGGKTTGPVEKAIAADGNDHSALQLSNDTIKRVRQLMEAAVGKGTSWEEIKDGLHAVLVNCQELRETAYEVSINNFIERRCRDAFGQALGKDDWVALWGERPQKKKKLDGQVDTPDVLDQQEQTNEKLEGQGEMEDVPDEEPNEQGEQKH